MIGLLYLATGFLIYFVYMLMEGAMLGMTTPIFTWSSLVIPPLFYIGPSLLIFTGIKSILKRAPRDKVCLITATVIVVGVAVWTVPRIGWTSASWIILEPLILSLLAAWLIQILVKKRWVLALIGSGLSAPYFLVGTGSLVSGLVVGNSVFSGRELWIIVPGVLVVLSFLSALRFRNY